MRTRALVSIVAAATALPAGGLAVSGCGAGVGGADVAKAAEATADKGTAKIDMTMTMTGLEKEPIVLKGTGITDLSKARLDMMFDLGGVAKSAGLGGAGASSGSAQVKVDGTRVWFKLPQLGGLSGGKPWMTVDIKQLLPALGIDPDQLSSMTRVSPAAQIQAITSMKSMKKVGEEEIDGDSVAHFKGEVSAKDMIATLPDDQRKQAEETLAKLKQRAGSDGPDIEKALSEPHPVELWVDGDNLLRRELITQAIPAREVDGKQQGGGTITIDMKLRDFGTKLNVSPPPADQTQDMTQMIAGFAKMAEQMKKSGGKDGMPALPGMPGATTTTP